VAAAARAFPATNESHLSETQSGDDPPRWRQPRPTGALAGKTGLSKRPWPGPTGQNGGSRSAGSHVCEAAGCPAAVHSCCLSGARLANPRDNRCLAGVWRAAIRESVGPGSLAGPLGDRL